MKKEMNCIRLELDNELFPETIFFLEKYQNEDLSAYELATGLVQCDKTVNMSRELFDFIVGLYEKAISEGDSYAMNDLGALYYDGRGCEQDFSKAVFYYEMAAKQGNMQAQENLGYCYYYGRDVEVDYEKAFHYFALGAFNGHLISLYKIGDMYQHGYYVEKNEIEAFRIYERCLDMMTEEAAPIVAGPVFLRLGNAFFYGIGTEMSMKKAQLCYQKAENYLYDMVARGNIMYKKNLQEAIEGQTKARERLLSTLPERKWFDGESD